MKRTVSLLLAMLLCAGLLFGCGAKQPEEKEETAAVPTTVHVASLKGPTTMGLVKMMEDAQAAADADAETNTVSDEYLFQMYGTPDEIVPLLTKGEIDVALLPCNLAAVLYQKLEGNIQVAAVNTLGVLYLVESGDSVKSVADLKGKKIYSTGKGTSPEYVLNYILTANGIDPQTDVTIEYKSESTELAVLLAQEPGAIAVLPQPYVTVVQMKNANVRVALDLTQEWDKVSTDSSLVTGVLLVRKAFAEENKAAFDSFLDAYQASAEFANENVSETAVLVEKYGIVEKAAIAEKAIPACNITYLAGDEMKTAVSGYLQVLYNADPKSVGGALPDEGFYYQK